MKKQNELEKSKENNDNSKTSSVRKNRFTHCQGYGCKKLFTKEETNAGCKLCIVCAVKAANKLKKREEDKEEPIRIDDDIIDIERAFRK